MSSRSHSVCIAPTGFTVVFENNRATCFVYNTMVLGSPASLSKEAWLCVGADWLRSSVGWRQIIPFVQAFIYLVCVYILTHVSIKMHQLSTDAIAGVFHSVNRLDSPARLNSSVGDCLFNFARVPGNSAGPDKANHARARG